MGWLWSFPFSSHRFEGAVFGVFFIGRRTFNGKSVNIRLACWEEFLKLAIGKFYMECRFYLVCFFYSTQNLLLKQFLFNFVLYIWRFFSHHQTDRENPLNTFLIKHDFGKTNAAKHLSNHAEWPIFAQFYKQFFSTLPHLGLDGNNNTHTHTYGKRLQRSHHNIYHFTHTFGSTADSFRDSRWTRVESKKFK